MNASQALLHVPDRVDGATENPSALALAEVRLIVVLLAPEVSR